MIETVIASALALLCQQAPINCDTTAKWQPTYTDITTPANVIGLSEQVGNQEFVRINPDYTFGYVNPTTHHSAAVYTATVLAHELAHTRQRREQSLSETNYPTCVAMETDAYQQEAAFWQWLWYNRLQPPTNALDTEFNSIAIDPATHATTECNQIYPH